MGAESVNEQEGRCRCQLGQQGRVMVRWINLEFSLLFIQAYSTRGDASGSEIQQVAIVIAS